MGPTQCPSRAEEAASAPFVPPRLGCSPAHHNSQASYLTTKLAAQHSRTLCWSLLHSAPPAYDLVYRRPALLLGASSPRGTAQFPSSPSIVTVRYPGHSSAMPRTIRLESRRHGPGHAMIDGTDLAASARAQRKEKIAACSTPSPSSLLLFFHPRQAQQSN